MPSKVKAVMSPAGFQKNRSPSVDGTGTAHARQVPHVDCANDDLPFAVRQILPGAHAVKTDVSLNPIKTRVLGVDRVAVESQDVAHLIE
jgi:hypothetical protein